jgi:hypothetical protein
MMMIVWILLAQYVANTNVPGWLVTAIQSASWTVAALLAAVIVLAQGLMFTVLLLRRSDALKSPDAEVITSVLSTIFVLQNLQQKQPNSLQTAATWLEELAKVIERSLRRKVGGVDELTSEVRSISAAVRRLRRSVLLGGLEGIQTARKTLASMLVPLARGDWTALEHAEAAPIAVHWALRLALRIFNVVAIAALPYIALGVLESGRIPIANADAMAKQLEFIAPWWALAAVLTALQPRTLEILGVAGKLAGK